MFKQLIYGKFVPFQIWQKPLRIPKAPNKRPGNCKWNQPQQLQHGRLYIDRVSGWSITDNASMFSVETHKMQQK